MKTRNFLLVAGLALAMAFTLSCGQHDGGGDDGNIGTCGSKEYDTSVYLCEKNEVIGYCKGSVYYPEYQSCDNGDIKNRMEISSSSDAGGNLLPSSSSDDISSSSSLREEVMARALKAEPVATSNSPSQPKIAVSWTDGQKNYYIIDVGTIRKTFISAIFGPEHYDGFHPVSVAMKSINTNTVTASTTETVSQSIAISNTFGIKMGLEEAVKAKIPNIGELSVKLNLEVSESVNVSNGKTTSTSVNNITSYVETQEISRTMTFGSNGAPTGYYRYALYGVSDVYFVIETSLDNQTLLSWDVISCVRSGDYLRHNDYSPDGNFDNSPSTENQIVFADDFYKTLLKPPSPKIKKTEIKEFITSGPFAFNKGVPATIEVYCLGPGGGAQGGHFSDLMGGGYGGIGGAGGGGEAAYMKFTAKESVGGGVVIGEGGAGGTGNSVDWDTDWRSGYAGYAGKNNTTVTLTSADISRTLSCNGGQGGGGEGKQTLDGGKGGTGSIRPANVQDFASAPGKYGSNGVRGYKTKGDIESKGGDSGELAIGSIIPFGSSGGAIREASQRPPNGSKGGGGASDISTKKSNRSGSKGGDGFAVIVVTYYE